MDVIVLVVWYLFMAAIVAFVVYRLRARAQLWRAGRPIDRSDRSEERWRGILADVLGQGRIRRRTGRGSAHFAVAWGTVLLALSMVVIIVQDNVSLPFLKGTFDDIFHLGIDLLALMVLGGVLVLAGRRYLRRPVGLDLKLDDAAILIGVVLVVLSGLLIEGGGVGISRSARQWQGGEDFALLRPAGLLVSELFRPFGSGPPAATAIAGWIEPLRWIHGFLAFGLLGLVGATKLSHVVYGPLNIYHRRLDPPGVLPAVDFENGPMGAETLADFTWKDRLDFDACIRCGRCQEACPAFNTGKPLSPKLLIQTLKGEMNRSANGTPASSANGEPSPNGQFLAGGTFSTDTVWACTTCMACMAACPMHVEHVPKIVQLRRHLVMVQNQVPDAAQAALHNLELRGHPWSGTTLNRTDWLQGLDVPVMAEGAEPEWLFWVGCAGALVERNVSSTRALAKILKTAGVSFGVLGDEEICNGDAARRLGAEHFFQMFAEQNLETLRRYGVKKVLTQCAHCFNTFKNEYPRLGLDLEVKHHTELIAELIQAGKLEPKKSVDLSVTFHDSCYLGRYNDVFTAPRAALDAVPGLERREMPRRQTESFCCGSGGGHAWLGDKIGQKINHNRTEEAAATGARVIAAGCPFCIQMFEDGVKGTGNEEKLQVLDVSEIVARSLE